MESKNVSLSHRCLNCFAIVCIFDTEIGQQGQRMKLPLPDEFTRQVARTFLVCVIILFAAIALVYFYPRIVGIALVFVSVFSLLWMAFAPLKKGD